MAFKSMVQYNEEKYGSFFTLVNDGNYADVIFLYQSKNDVLVADAHYIKSADYSGYVHCCGSGCPACAKGIRTQGKLFIPMYNLTEKKIQFWDRTTKFEAKLMNDVFDKFPNPSEYVFRITRHGVAGDVNTTYEIKAVYNNPDLPYAKILADASITLPDGYSAVIKEVTPFELDAMVNVSSSVAVPRDAYVPAPPVTVAPESIVGSFNEPVSIADLSNLPTLDASASSVPSVDDLQIPEVFNPQPTESATETEGDVDNVDF